mgnify:CR=1 FL=1
MRTRIQVVLDAERRAPPEALPCAGAAASPDQAVVLGIRPEHIGLGAATAPSLSLSAKIDRIEQLGAQQFLYCSVGGGRAADRACGGRRFRMRTARQVTVTLPVADSHLFAAAEGGAAFRADSMRPLVHARFAGQAADCVRFESRSGLAVPRFRAGGRSRPGAVSARWNAQGATDMDGRPGGRRRAMGRP